MAKLTIKEVAEMLGVEPKNIHALCSPTKMSLIKDKDNFIDTGLAQNKRYIEKRLGKKLVKDGDAGNIVSDKPVTVHQKTKAALLPNQKFPVEKPKSEKYKEFELLNSFQIEKEQLTIEKLKKENRKRELEIEKLEGDFISVSEAESYVMQFSEIRDKHLMNSIENHINYICMKESIPQDRAGKYKNKVIEIINECNKYSQEQLILKEDE